MANPYDQPNAVGGSGYKTFSKGGSNPYDQPFSNINPYVQQQQIRQNFVPAGGIPGIGNKSALATALSRIGNYGRDDQIRIIQRAALSGVIDRSKASQAVRDIGPENVPQPKLSPFQKFSQFAVPTAKNLVTSTGKAVGQTEAGLLNYLINRHPTSGAVQNIVAKAGPVGQKVSSFVGKPSGKELALSAAQTAVLGLGGPVSKGIEAAAGRVLPKAVSKVLGAGGVGAGYNVVATPPPKGGKSGKSGKEFLKEAGVGAGLGGGLSILGQAVSKAVAARKAGVPLPPSALDKHVDAIPKETTSLPTSSVTKTSPTPVTTGSKAVGKGTKAAQFIKQANLEAPGSKETLVAPVIGRGPSAGRVPPAFANVPEVNVPRLATDIPKGPGAFKRGVSSVSGVLSNLGQSGKEIAGRLTKAQATSETGQAQFLAKIPAVKNLKGQSFNSFVDTLDKLSAAEKTGGDKAILDSLPPKMRQAVDQWTQHIPEVRQRAEAAGIQVGDLGKYYFPRNYSEVLKNQSGFNRAAQHLVDTKQAKDIPEAIQALNFMKSKYASPFGHFENSRSGLDLPGYDKSRNALTNYVSGAYNKIGHAEQFGGKGEVANRLIANIAGEGRDANLALRYYQTATGILRHDQPALENVSQKIRGYQRVTKLGLSSILNATQSTNTAAVSGIARTASAALKLLAPAERAYVEKTGTTIETVIRNLREQAGAASQARGWLGKIMNAPGFNQVEKFNRGVAAIAGRDWANSLAAKGNTRSLNILRNKLGVEGDIGRKLTEEQQIQASRKLVELTQFKTDPKDLPGWAQSPMGKMAVQFRTFSYKQTGYIYNELIKEARRGNVLPLMRYLAVGIPLGIGAGQIRGTLRGQPSTSVKGKQTGASTSRGTQIYEGLNNVGAFGLGSDVKFLGQNVKSSRFPQYLASTAGGPTAGLAAQTAINVQQAASGKPQALERQGIQQTPVAGPILANKLLPYKPSGKTQLTDLVSQNKQLSDKFKQIGYVPGSPSKTQHGRPLSDQQYNDFVKQSGQAFMRKAQAAINDPAFQSLSTADKKRSLNLQMTEARREYLDKQFGKYKSPKQTKLKKY